MLHIGGVSNDVERGLVTVKEGIERGVPVVIVKVDGMKAGATALVKGPAGAPPAAATAKAS
jgi:hypothetical protein